MDCLYKYLTKTAIFPDNAHGESPPDAAIERAHTSQLPASSDGPLCGSSVFFPRNASPKDRRPVLPAAPATCASGSSFEPSQELAPPADELGTALGLAATAAT